MCAGIKTLGHDLHESMVSDLFVGGRGAVGERNFVDAAEPAVQMWTRLRSTGYEDELPMLDWSLRIP